jgi:hypothetical protein
MFLAETLVLNKKLFLNKKVFSCEKKLISFLFHGFLIDCGLIAKLSTLLAKENSGCLKSITTIRLLADWLSKKFR